MNGELESLMRDVGRVVEGEAQRQNILPQVQARLAARQLPTDASGRRSLEPGARESGRLRGRRLPLSAPARDLVRRGGRGRRGGWRGAGGPGGGAAGAAVLRRVGGHAAAARGGPRRRARLRRRDGGDRRGDAGGLGHPSHAHPLAGAGGRLPHPGDGHALRRRLGLPEPRAHGDDARGLGAGQRPGARSSLFAW